jgi:hypothetical protein
VRHRIRDCRLQTAVQAVPGRSTRTERAGPWSRA